MSSVTRDDLIELLRERGLRITPQRRAILDAFSHAASEHLSADEIHARAAAVVPELGRGTVYAALAELTELGILAARGSPEPVRYEANTAPHQHFRCRVCLRLFDVAIPDPDTSALAAGGFAVEHIAVVAEGICAECQDYEKGLRAGAASARKHPGDLPPGLAAAAIDTPLGPLSLGATPEGVVRIVFDNHADAPALEEARRGRRGGRAAREHIAAAKSAVADYFAGRPLTECSVGWSQVSGAESLQATLDIPSGRDLSYEHLETTADATELGRALGANPIAILLPCHRVTRGREVPLDYVGGADRLRALRALERP